MTKEINLIFNNNIRLLSNMDKLVHFFRIQNYDRGLRIATNIIDQLSSSIELLISQSEYFNTDTVRMSSDTLLEMMRSILDAQSTRDYILLADLYEIQIIPFIISLQEYIIGREEFDFPEGNYTDSINLLKVKDPALAELIIALPLQGLAIPSGPAVEFASCGLMTLTAYDHGLKFYLHSNRNVSGEAFRLASSWYREEKTKYIIYGLGLGYHVMELSSLDDGIQIEVYESDLNVIHLACAYTGMKNILSDSRIKLTYDPDFSKMMSRIDTLSEGTELVLHYPSVRMIKNDIIRERLEEYFIQYSSINNQSSVLRSNFNHNMLLQDNAVDVLAESFGGKDLYIVAAGPSLDLNFLLLKERKANSILLATGTVFHKLMKASIQPDYVIVTDANSRVYKQIRGLEESSVPMLYLSTANKQVTSNYRGNRYIIFQEGYPKAEDYAKENGFHLHKTGGSVSTTALDIGIRFGCRRIIFLGLDLAYTNNYVHAADTSRRELKGDTHLLQVTDIHGDKIYTTKTLTIYRKWIENRIADASGIEFINATEGGVKIKGMRHAKLMEVLSE